jgi:hypothetical protein
MSTDGIELFTGDEILDQLVRREGPDGAVRLFNAGARYPVASVAEIRERLAH